MIFKVFLLVVSATAVLSRPQFLTFENGKFGVNFGGYHAEAGLGGLLTGNAAHGGLSASAGTPYGQQAGAGLGGGLDGHGKSSGGAYAGASAGYGVGASAALGGGLNGEGGGGGVGAESHVPGKVTKVVKLAQLNPSASFDATKEINEVPSSNIATRFNVEESDATHKEVQTVAQAPVSAPVIVKTVHKKKFIHHQPAVVYEKRIQYEPAQVQVQQQVEHKEIPTYTQTPTHTNLDYKKFFDFGFFSNIAAGFGGPHATYTQQQQPQVVYEKSYAPITYEKQFVVQKEIPATVEKQVEIVKRVDANVDSQVIVQKQVPHPHVQKQVTFSGSTGGNFFNDIFNIPISALTSVNRFLNNNVGGNVHYQKTVGVY